MRAKLTNASTWIDELPTVLLGLRAALNTDTGVSAAELTYGFNLRLPGKFFNASNDALMLDYTYVDKLRGIIQQNKPQIPTKNHSNNKSVFVHEDLLKCSHVFIRTDAVKKPLQAPYDGPYRIISRTDKVYVIQLPGRQASISIDRLKPAYVITEDTSALPPMITVPNTITVTRETKQSTSSAVTNKTQIPQASMTSHPAEKKTRSGRVIKLPSRFA